MGPSVERLLLGEARGEKVGVQLCFYFEGGGGDPKEDPRDTVALTLLDDEGWILTLI